MIKTKIFKENTSSDLEWEVNKFFKRNPKTELVDIKFQAVAVYTGFEIRERYAAMVIYK